MSKSSFVLKTDFTKQLIYVQGGNSIDSKVFVTIRDLYGQIIKNMILTMPGQLDISTMRAGSYMMETMESRQIITLPFDVSRSIEEG